MRTCLRLCCGALLFVCAVASAQENSGPASGKVLTFVSGAASAHIYTNDFLGFSYTLPEGFSDITEWLRGRSHLRSGAYLLLAADRRHDGANNDLLTVLAHAKTLFKPCCLPLKEFVSKGVVELEGLDDFHLLQDSVLFEVPNHQFYRAIYTQTSDKSVRYKAIVVTEFDDYYVEWNFDAASRAELDQVANSLQGFRLNGPPSSNVLGSIMSGPSAPASPPKRVPISQEATQQLLIKRVPPTYPEIARTNGIQGKAVMHAIISREGEVKELTVISCHPMLCGAALDAVKMWKYKPYLLDGEPVEIDTQISVEFTLPRS